MVTSALEFIWKKLDLNLKNAIGIILLGAIFWLVWDTRVILNDLVEKEYRHGYEVMESIEGGFISLDPEDNQYIGTKPALRSDLKDACLNETVLKRLEYYFKDASQYCKLVN